jgi:hypothetical protein
MINIFFEVKNFVIIIEILNKFCKTYKSPVPDLGFKAHYTLLKYVVYVGPLRFTDNTKSVGIHI